MRTGELSVDLGRAGCASCGLRERTGEVSVDLGRAGCCCASTGFRLPTGEVSVDLGEAAGDFVAAAAGEFSEDLRDLGDASGEDLGDAAGLVDLGDFGTGSGHKKKGVTHGQIESQMM